MAKLIFKDSHDLINYLCKKEVLGNVEVLFEPVQSSHLQPVWFNFTYPDLENHLGDIVWGMLEYNGSFASSIKVDFEDADNFSWNGSEDHSYDRVEQEFKHILEKRFGKDSFAYISLAGADTFEPEEVNVGKFQILKWITNEDGSSGEEELELSREEREMFLKEILQLLQNYNGPIECLEQWNFEVEAERANFNEEGGLLVNNVMSLKDNREFELDTDQLKKRLEHRIRTIA